MLREISSSASIFSAKWEARSAEREGEVVRRLKEGGECAFRGANLPTKFQMPDSVDNPSVSYPVGWGISPLWLTYPRASRGKSWVRFIQAQGCATWVEKRA